MALSDQKRGLIGTVMQLPCFCNAIALRVITLSLTQASGESLAARHRIKHPEPGGPADLQIPTQTTK
jgi:hypothetical protein